MSERELNENEKAVLTALRRRKDHEATIAELVELLPKSKNGDATSPVRNALRRPVKRGLIQKTERGTYRLMEAGQRKEVEAMAERLNKSTRGKKAKPTTLDKAELFKRAEYMLNGSSGNKRAMERAAIVLAAHAYGDSRQTTRIAVTLGLSRGKVINAIKAMKLPKVVTNVSPTSVRDYVGVSP